MHIYQRMLCCMLSAIILVLCGCQNRNDTAESLLPEVTGNFDFTILKIGQADAMILRTANHSVIIDCGEEDDGNEILEYLQTNGIKTVDYLFITHFDKDHVGGAAKVIENVNIKNIITPDYEGTNAEFESYHASAKQENITPTLLTENMSFTLDDVLLEIFPPLKKAYKEGDNDFSLAIAATHGENTFLFAGDAEEERLTEIMSQTGKEYDFLKIPHHGRYSKKTKAFIETVKPSYAVITCSKKNPAEEETVSVLENEKCNIYYTKDGDVNVTSDGYKIEITQLDDCKINKN